MYAVLLLCELSGLFIETIHNVYNENLKMIVSIFSVHDDEI